MRTAVDGYRAPDVAPFEVLPLDARYDDEDYNSHWETASAPKTSATGFTFPVKPGVLSPSFPVWFPLTFGSMHCLVASTKILTLIV